MNIGFATAYVPLSLTILVVQAARLLVQASRLHHDAKICKRQGHRPGTVLLGSVLGTIEGDSADGSSAFDRGSFGPAAYPYPVASVEVHQTHISAVFVAGPYVYKIKKSVNLGFLDFSTLKQRQHFCEQEVRLNRRLAPHVYLGVVPVVRTGERMRLEEKGEIVEWAEKEVPEPERGRPCESTGTLAFRPDRVGGAGGANPALS